MAQHIPAQLFRPLADLIGDLFSFRELELILYQCSGDRKRINSFTNAGLPPRKVGEDCLQGVEKDGTVKAFLSLAIEARPDNAELKATVLGAMPEVAVAAAETKAKVSLVVSSLNETRQGLNDPAVKGAVATSRDTLRAFAAGVDVLAAYKNLHDSLHQIQVRRFSDLQAAAATMAADLAQVEKLRDFQDRLRTCVSVARPSAMVLPDDALLREIELGWIERLETAAENLRQAINKRDGRAARMSLIVVDRTLQREPSRLNELIFKMAKRLPVQELIAAMEAAGMLDQHVGDMLAKACDALRDIRATLLRRVVDHHMWQDVDDNLWALDQVFLTSGDDVFLPFAVEWPVTKTMVKELADGARGTDWAKAILEYSDLLDDELTRSEGETGAAGAPGRGLKAIRDELQLRYNDYRHEVRFHFFMVDQLLRNDCTAIVAIGAPLQSMLKDLEHA